MKVDRGNREIAVCSLHFNTRWTWVVTITLWSLDPQGSSGCVWRCENLLTLGL